MNTINITLSAGILLLLMGGYTHLKSSGTAHITQDDEGFTGRLIGKKAPELYEGDWINSSGHKLSDFRGKVVLVEFWTYGCYNCRNTIPAINDWQKKYEGKNFLIIGVHTPEFDREKNLASLRQQVAQLDVQYAVVTDNEYRTWEAYHQQYWPTLYVIDKQGIIRFVQIGEGNYEETERMIQLLIAER